MPALLEARDLRVRRGGVVVLDRISLSAGAGEFLTLCGSSGVGKSSLLLALGGFIPSEGHLRVQGKIGVVFQNHAAFDWMTVAGNIRFGLRDRFPADEQTHRVEALLARTGLTHLTAKFPQQLSGGELQRLGLARALAAEPDLLFMDEPFSALDSQRRYAMQQWLLDLWAEDRKLIVFVTHDLEEALRLSDRVVLVRPGQGLLDVPIPFPRPRPVEIVFSSEFNNLKRELATLLA